MTKHFVGPPKNVLERLLLSIPTELDESICWPCTFKPVGKNGHMVIRLDDKTRRMVHRVAWEAHNAEPVPEGMIVMHTCDNPPCCNPSHLRLGTHADNTADMYAKGRDVWSNRELHNL